jgi:hypothetical protein
MSELAIRCHPSAPVPAEELEQWLGQEVERLRASAPQAVLRLVRLTQRLPSGDVDIGWMIELDAANGEPVLDEDGLATVVRDMRLLGLQPTVLRVSEHDDAPAPEPGAHQNSRCPPTHDDRGWA